MSPDVGNGVGCWSVDTVLSIGAVLGREFRFLLRTDGRRLLSCVCIFNLQYRLKVKSCLRRLNFWGRATTLQRVTISG